MLKTGGGNKATGNPLWRTKMKTKLKHENTTPSTCDKASSADVPRAAACFYRELVIISGN